MRLVSVSTVELIKGTEYQGRRSRYELAFRQFARAVECLHDLEETGAADSQVLEARKQAECAHGEYLLSRNLLADYLMVRRQRCGEVQLEFSDTVRSVPPAQIRKAAYFIWEKEGRPAGNDQADWFRAESASQGCC